MSGCMLCNLSIILVKTLLFNTNTFDSLVIHCVLFIGKVVASITLSSLAFLHQHGFIVPTRMKLVTFYNRHRICFKGIVW